MKKIQIIIMTFLFTLSVTTSYAGIYENHITYGEETAGRSGGFFGNSDGDSGRETSEDSGGFFRASPEDGLTERPGSGGGIGQESAPLGDGLYTLATCCVIWGFMKNFIKNKKKKSIKMK